MHDRSLGHTTSMHLPCKTQKAEQESCLTHFHLNFVMCPEDLWVVFAAIIDLNRKSESSFVFLVKQWIACTVFSLILSAEEASENY